MTDQFDEHEQGERVRKWLQNNGTSLLGGVALGLLAIGGWQYWQSSKSSHLLEAAEQYGRFQKALEEEKPDQIEAIGKALTDKYGETPYAVLATLRQANTQFKAKKTDEAVKLLEKAIGLADDATLKQLIVLRVARIELSTDKIDEAVARLKTIDVPALTALREELAGDIAMKQGKLDQARTAYKEALTLTDSASPMKNILELKLTSAGGSLDETTPTVDAQTPAQTKES